MSEPFDENHKGENLNNTGIYDFDDKYKESWSRSSENKVKIGCIANIFQPGSANQISIRYDDWISEESIMYSPVIKKFYDFIIDILELN